MVYYISFVDIFTGEYTFAQSTYLFALKHLKCKFLVKYTGIESYERSEKSKAITNCVTTLIVI